MRVGLGIIILVLLTTPPIDGCQPKKLPLKCQTEIKDIGLGGIYAPRNCQTEAQSARSLTFDKSDVIRCFIGRLGFHFLLSTSPTHVIHISGVISKRHIAKIIEEPFLNATSKYERCQIYTSCAECDLLEMEIEPTLFSDDSAVDRARRAQRLHMGEIYYDLLYCNCEHWVLEWKYGKAVSQQGRIGGWKKGKTDSKCKVN